MNKGIVLALTMLVIIPAVSAADQCLPAASYQVEVTSFSKKDAESAIRTLLKKTPLNIYFAAKGVEHRISADGVSGDLDSVLTSLSESAGLAWEQKDCRILISKVETAPVVALPVWNIRQGERYSAVMSNWGKSAGWQVFWEAGELESEVNHSFTGAFEDAVTKAVEVLAGQGVPLHAWVYDGNRVIRIMEKK